MGINLELYKHREFLTVHEVACLFDEVDPNSGWFSDNYSTVVELISESITLDLKTAFAYGELGSLSVEDCKKYNIFFDDYHTARTASLATPITEESISVQGTTKVSYERLLSWFEYKGLKPSFFFSEYISKQPLPHQTNLMKILYKTIDRYYGENYDPNDKDSIPKQEHVIEWLKETYSLTHRQAEAIDIVTRPRKSK